MKKILSLLLLSSSLFGMDLALVPVVHQRLLSQPNVPTVVVSPNITSNKMLIEAPSVFVPNRLGDIKLLHDKKGFSVIKDNQKHVIERYNTDKIVRNMTKEELLSFLAVGYVSLNQMDNGDYSLKANGRINGGGPILGTIAYWTTKVICYAIPVAALGTAVVVTGGAAGAAVAGGAAAAGTVVTTAAATTGTIATTVGAVTTTAAAGAIAGGAAGVAGAAVAGAGLATEAAVVTAAAVSTTGTVAGTVVAIEALSTAVGTFFGMLPTP